jgi:iron-sulfur cluster repair protein YtfE (RIC family)
MLVATTGVLPPVVGAMVQEGIDVIVILNALRALTGGMERTPQVPGWSELGTRLRHEHRDLGASLGRIRPLADELDAMALPTARAQLESMRTFLVEDLVPHEQSEDREVFPLLAASVGNDDVTAGLHRTHTEIFHLVRYLDRLVREVADDGPAPEDLTDLRRVLYGLDAIMRLHMAQEEELYLALGDEHPAADAEPEHHDAAA